jgi:hypothetical protein
MDSESDAILREPDWEWRSAAEDSPEACDGSSWT